jgi:hypothetical protein
MVSVSRCAARPQFGHSTLTHSAAAARGEVPLRGQRFTTQVVGQPNRQLFIRYWYFAALGAMDDGDGRAPEALAAQEPIAQPEVHELLPGALLGENFDCGRNGL